MKKLTFFAITIMVLFSFLSFAQTNTQTEKQQVIEIPRCMKEAAKLMKNKNLKRIVIQSIKDKNKFIGFQYLGRMGMIINAEVTKDNRSVILDALKKKDYEKAYRLLNVLVGNKVITISDSEYDTLRISPESTDFVKVGGKIVFFNSSVKEAGFKNKEEFEKFRDKYNKLYLDSIREIIKKLK